MDHDFILGRFVYHLIHLKDDFKEIKLTESILIATVRLMDFYLQKSHTQSATLFEASEPDRRMPFLYIIQNIIDCYPTETAFLNFAPLNQHLSGLSEKDANTVFGFKKIPDISITSGMIEVEDYRGLQCVSNL